MKDICNVIQRVVLFIFVAPAKILDWRNAFLVLQYKRNANVWIFLRGHVSKHLALSVERVESPKICFPLIFGHMEA